MSDLSLDTSKLENVKTRGSKTTAACPACRAAGGDKKGDHLVIFQGGKYGCAAFQGDKPHRQEIFAHAGILKELTAAEKKAWAKRKYEADLADMRRIQRKKRQEQITDKIKAELESKLEPYLSDEWKVGLWESSPIRFDHMEAAPRDFLQFLFKPKDILWLGGQYDSGKPKHAANFRTCADWIKDEVLPERIAAGTFKPGSISRCGDNVLTSPYIVLESDKMIGHKPITDAEKEVNKAMFAAFIIYAQKRLGLILRVVIDTGNKSLHAWFDRPPEGALKVIKSMAEGLRLDSDVINNGDFSPLRMPHCIHDDTKQSAQIIYLNPITA